MFGMVFIIVGGIFALRVLVHFFTTGLVSPFVPSAIAAGFFLLFGFQVIVLGLLADMVRGNRELVEEVLFHQRL